MGINVQKMLAMPFGVHKGKSLDDVPAEYLDWLRGQEWVRGRWPDVWSYIESHKASIDKDLRAARSEKAALREEGEDWDPFE